MGFARSVATVGGLTMVSRLAGFARDVLTAAVLGAGPVADAFFVALKLPNLFRRMFAEGAFAVAFVPLFAAELERRGRAGALAFAGTTLLALVAVLLPFTLVAEAAMPALLHLMAPGFAGRSEVFTTAVHLARLTFPYLPLITLVALLGGMLNALGRFAPAAAAPVLFNLTLVVALLAAPPLGLDPGPALAAAVSLSGVVQLAWMLWFCRAYRALPAVTRRPHATPLLGRLVRLMGPAALGAGVTQINTVLGVVLASLLPAGSVSFLYYADRLHQMPLGIVGVALGTALLPLLSRQIAAGDAGAARDSMARALEAALMLGLPAAVALAVAGTPMVAVLFQRGAFDGPAVDATAAALAAFALGIPGTLLAKVLGTAFFARHDTATPMRAAIVATLANATAALALMPVLGHVGIALAGALGAWLNAGLLARALKPAGLGAVDERLARRAPRIVLAAAGMAVALRGALLPMLAPWLAGSGLARASALGLLVAGGAVVFFALAQGLKATDLTELRGVLKRRERGGLTPPDPASITPPSPEPGVLSP
jgi:putative peptidoglycan lipid II flippase